jgi:hypothetical protein
MADLTKGHTWATSDLITATGFNDTVDLGQINTAFLTAKTERTPISGDFYIYYDTTNAAWKKVQVQNTYGISTASPAYTNLGDVPGAFSQTCNSSLASQNAYCRLTGNATLTLSGSADGMQGILIVKQDGTGGRTLTLPSGSFIPGSGTSGTGPADLITTLNRETVCIWTMKGANYYWTFVKY